MLVVLTWRTSIRPIRRWEERGVGKGGGSTDWSSDVCSSDLRPAGVAVGKLVAGGELDVADPVAVGIEHAVLRGTGEDLPADRIAADPAVGHPELQFQVVGQAVAGAQGAGDACGLDLAHVDQADQDRRDDGVAEQRDTVDRKSTRLTPRFPAAPT